MLLFGVCVSFVGGNASGGAGEGGTAWYAILCTRMFPPICMSTCACAALRNLLPRFTCEQAARPLRLPRHPSHPLIPAFALCWFIHPLHYVGSGSPPFAMFQDGNAQRASSLSLSLSVPLNEHVRVHKLRHLLPRVTCARADRAAVAIAVASIPPINPLHYVGSGSHPFAILQNGNAQRATPIVRRLCLTHKRKTEDATNHIGRRVGRFRWRCGRR